MAHSVSIRQSWHQHNWTKTYQNISEAKLRKIVYISTGITCLDNASWGGFPEKAHLDTTTLEMSMRVPIFPARTRHREPVKLIGKLEDFHWCHDFLQDGDPIHPRVHAVVKVINEQLVPWQNRNWPMYLWGWDMLGSCWEIGLLLVQVDVSPRWTSAPFIDIIATIPLEYRFEYERIMANDGLEIFSSSSVKVLKIDGRIENSCYVWYSLNLIDSGH